MVERLILPVDIRNKVLCPFGKVQNSLKIDDFGAGCLHRGILSGQEPKIAQLIWLEGLFGFHKTASFFCPSGCLLAGYSNSPPFYTPGGRKKRERNQNSMRKLSKLSETI